jgi:hypothetical protein
LDHNVPHHHHKSPGDDHPGPTGTPSAPAESILAYPQWFEFVRYSRGAVPRFTLESELNGWDGPRGTKLAELALGLGVGTVFCYPYGVLVLAGGLSLAP